MPTLTFNLSLDEINMVIQGLNYIQRDSQTLMNKLSASANSQIAAAQQAAADAQKATNATPAAPAVADANAAPAANVNQTQG